MPESPFSKKLPRLQLAWDATSMNALMFCPEYYRLTILDGWRGSGIDLEFGLMYHTALELFDKERCKGVPAEEAQYVAVRYILDTTVIRAADGTWKPWAGSYEELWHCLHDPGKGKKKCSYAHAGKWFPGPAPSQCGQCGSEIAAEVRFIAEHPQKNRNTLIRTVIWYCAEQGDDKDRGIHTYVFPDGTPAIELSASGVPTGVKASTGEEFTLAAHLDGICTTVGENFLRERKSTKSGLGKYYYSTFSPNTQIDTYDLIGTILFSDLDIKGVLIEAAQTMVNGSRFGSHTEYRTPELRAEFLDELSTHWFPLAERLARIPEDKGWPKARSQCRFCKLNEVCNKNPDKREMFLKADFEKNPWNPLDER